VVTLRPSGSAQRNSPKGGLGRRLAARAQIIPGVLLVTLVVASAAGAAMAERRARLPEQEQKAREALLMLRNGYILEPGERPEIREALRRGTLDARVLQEAVDAGRAARDRRILRAIEQGLAPELIAGFEDFARRVGEAEIEAARRKASAAAAARLVERVASGECPAEDHRERLARYVEDGLLSQETLEAATEEGTSRMARDHLDGFGPEDLVFPNREALMATLHGARVTDPGELAAYIRRWEDLMSRRALYLLAVGTRVEDWREHLERGEGRRLFDAETIAIAWEEFVRHTSPCEAAEP
jgi:hypothetical protein